MKLFRIFRPERLDHFPSLYWESLYVKH
jgi:hypothetical protein